jgi:general secretion pathway protein A
MYTDYFKFSEPPFSLTPDPRYLFMSERHREGLAHLFYGVQQPGGFVQLTGEVGCGKTTLSRCLVRQLPSETDIALILNPRLSAIELLSAVCDELMIPYPAEKGSIKLLIDAINKHLLEAHARGRRTVLIIDEAQNLATDVLEQIRLLTNLETSQEKLLQIILIGQPELIALLERRELRQLAQRITARYHLLPLSKHETHAYIRHRLAVAGKRDPIFTDAAMRSVRRLSGGVPRLINIICDRALLGAYALDRRQVKPSMVQRASRETQGHNQRRLRFRLAWVAGLALLLVAGAIFWGLVNFPKFVRKAMAVSSTHEKQALSSGPHSTPAAATANAKAEAPIKPDPSSNKESGVAAKAPGSAGIRLTDLLSGAGSRRAPLSNVSDLFVRWGLKSSSKSSESGCKAAKARGFECLFLVGSWPKLRRYNIPAILEFVLPTGVRQRVLLAGLNNETATLEISGREYTFPLSEIDRVWDGSFIILWKPPFAARQLAPGARGQNVFWVKRALDALDKKASAADVSDLYDEGLRKRVASFQKEQSLIQDGSIGTETLVRLTLAIEGPNAPSLSRGTR